MVNMTTSICVVNLFYELILECMWQHIAILGDSERKHVSWHCAIGYRPSPSIIGERDIPPKENNLRESRG